MTKEELSALLSTSESSRIERTTSTKDMDKFQEAICAFSNDMSGSREKGFLLIGVDDKGKIDGLKATDELMTRISGIRSSGNILPLPVMATEKVETEEGDVVVVSVTPSTSTPVRYHGRVFIRIGPRKDIASAEEERILAERSSAFLSTFDMNPCNEATLDDLDLDMVKRLYLPQAIEPETLESDTRSLTEQMASLRLYNKKHACPTVAAVVLFGKDPRHFIPGCYIQYVRFSGTTKAGEILNEKEFKGGLFAMLPRLEAFVQDSVVTSKPVEASLLRERTVSNYPGLALRELLMNACMHRTYESNTPIRFYQYDDRIEIMNAGGLYGEARPENFPNVNAYRNPVIAEAMKVMKYVNMFNRGISRVQEYLSANNSLPARFDVAKLTVFEVTIDDASYYEGSEETANKLRTNFEQAGEMVKSLQKQLILGLLEGEMSIEEFKLRTNFEQAPQPSNRYLQHAIVRPLIELGIVERRYPDKPRHPKQKYRLTRQGEAAAKTLR